jgi:hypothetical protein
MAIGFFSDYADAWSGVCVSFPELLLLELGAIIRNLATITARLQWMIDKLERPPVEIALANR